MPRWRLDPAASYLPARVTREEGPWAVGHGIMAWVDEDEDEGKERSGQGNGRWKVIMRMANISENDETSVASNQIEFESD